MKNELHSILRELFIDPLTKKSLTYAFDSQKLTNEDCSFDLSEGVIDFQKRNLSSSNLNESIPTPLVEMVSNQAPELRDEHDKAFRETENDGGNIYGKLEDLPTITQSGHFRRMEILSEVLLGDVGNKIAVDFGTGPWGFGSIFPNLAKAKICIGFDVSSVALRISRKTTDREINEKTIYATSDGEIIPLLDDSVDIFFGGEVIEHVRNPMLFMQEIARVCKDGALVILTTPNRDALNYKMLGQPYCVGPEHIALLNYVEFKRILNRYSKNIAIVGYETSLGIGMDCESLDEEMFSKIQQRANNFPEFSSGLISISNIDKDAYKRNYLKRMCKEYLWNSPKVVLSEPKGALPLTLFGDVKGLCLMNQMQAKVQVQGSELILLFWGHDWSGMAQVICGDYNEIIDLYSINGGFIRVEINNANLNSELIIHQLAKKNEKSRSNQVILYKIMEYVDETAKQSIEALQA